MRTFSSDNLDTLDMRASTLTFIFIISECSIITGGDGNCRDPPEIKNAKIVKNVTHRFRMNCTEGYSRKVGSSNLFKCENNTWRNIPPLVCIQLVGPTPSVSPSQSSLTQKVTGMKEKGQSTTNGVTDKIKDNRKQILGISLGIVVLVILGVAVAVAVLFMCRRSKSHRAGGNPVHMKCLTLGSEHPLIMNVTSSGAPDSVQSSFTPFKDASENMYTDDPLSV
ncbi:interleukin-15 receptor subunit alpha isoform X2 [Tachysurus fulvidraco]|uniref:interleukin-15 receptor subunit alpha isoform X2 n=1 Tax=Tachysurus fulvidraco TaxID=1234273 RepID=UPI000F50D706|nr:interleukin-15 receptor subunit alpha isoform X2 [Tachysurus fulvidraco]